jgi:hypothetical protein
MNVRMTGSTNLYANFQRPKPASSRFGMAVTIEDGDEPLSEGAKALLKRVATDPKTSPQVAGQAREVLAKDANKPKPPDSK